MKLNLNTGLSALPKIGAGTGPAPFPNTYSTELDGVDDYMAAPLDGTATGGILAVADTDINVTVSLWVRLSTSVATQGIFQWALVNRPSYTQPFLLIQQNSLEIRVHVDNAYQTATTIVLDTWYHIAIIRDSATNIWTGYKDGVSFFTHDDSGTPSWRVNTESIYFGTGYNGTIAGNIDEASVFNEAKAIGDLWDGTGTPTNLASESGLVAWYRMGDSAVFNADSQWEFREQTKINNWSSHSFEFDGVNDRVDFGSTVNLGSTSSESIWIKQDTPTVGEVVVGTDWSTTSAGNSYHIYLDGGSNAGRCYIRIGAYYFAFDDAATKSAINTTDWIHLAIIRTGADTMRLYVNGMDNDGEINSGNGPASGDIEIDTLGMQHNGIYQFKGLIDGYSAWDTALTSPNVTSIYADGVPNDVSDLGISGLVGYWRMGEGASFAGGSWTIPDVSTNSNDGTSSGMNEADNINNAPDNENQGLSVGMVSGSVVEETP